MLSAAGLGRHRSARHGIAGAGKPAKGPKHPVVIELIDEELPPPPEPKKKPIDEILGLLEHSDLEAERWWRIALFDTGRGAKATATRLRKHEYGQQFDWQATDDGRLFVQVRND